MLSRIFRQLFGFGRTKPHVLEADAGTTIFLHGRDNFSFDVIGTSRHETELVEIAGGGVQPGQDFQCVAALVLSEGKDDRRFSVAVSIDRRIVGYFPANLATQYREWLHKWGLTHAGVQCNAIIVVDRNPIRLGAYDYTVKLDIELPFKMTTL